MEEDKIEPQRLDPQGPGSDPGGRQKLLDHPEDFLSDRREDLPVWSFYDSHLKR